MDLMIERYVVQIEPVNCVVFKDTESDWNIISVTFKEFSDAESCMNALIPFRDECNKMYTQILSLKLELHSTEQLLRSYRKTVKHDAELLADATRNGYLPPLDGWQEVDIDG